MSGDPVRLEREPGGPAVVTFDSPPLNLFDAALGEGLKAAVAALAAEPPAPCSSARRAARSLAAST